MPVPTMSRLSSEDRWRPGGRRVTSLKARERERRRGMLATASGTPLRPSAFRESSSSCAAGQEQGSAHASLSVHQQHTLRKRLREGGREAGSRPCRAAARPATHLCQFPQRLGHLVNTRFRPFSRQAQPRQVEAAQPCEALQQQQEASGKAGWRGWQPCTAPQSRQAAGGCRAPAARWRPTLPGTWSGRSAAPPAPAGAAAAARATTGRCPTGLQAGRVRRNQSEGMHRHTCTGGALQSGMLASRAVRAQPATAASPKERRRFRRRMSKGRASGASG
jgi:hypothetical protein